MNNSTILIVDDEPTNLSVLSKILSPQYQVRACKSGEQALLSANREPRPDLVLLDVMMPGMDGYTVLSRLREDEKTRDIPAIFITALDAEVDEEHGLALGAVDYITKPIKPAIVQARVRAHLEIKHSRDRLTTQAAWLEAEVTRRMRENLLIQDVSLGVLAQLVETRDDDVGNHIVRTKSYMEVLARRLAANPAFARELDELRLGRIVKASPLHDIGKIGIPDHILLKSGRLNDEEWEIMKTHVRIGADAIRHAMDKSLALYRVELEEHKPESLAFLEVAEVIARGHHERWDGTGYPDSLSGREIPLAARLMALPDVFDALTTPRIYKDSWSAGQAIAYIQEQAGKHFDPEIVLAFEASLDDFESIRRNLADSHG